ncbi:MAG: translation initiation factor IF-2 N-terminal domain-containing protein, partial [Leptospiraceae bacterium]|nr:translation initiation factor IF-2 N-terminal domain-containing protein [Leptospiraceae bacterium]
MMDEKKAKESTIKEHLGGVAGKKIVIKKKSTASTTESKKPLDEIFDQTKLEQAKQELPRKEEIQVESPQQTKSSTEKPKPETEAKPASSSTEKTVVTPQTSSSSQVASPKSNNPIMGKLERNPIVSKPTKVERQAPSSTGSSSGASQKISSYSASAKSSSHKHGNQSPQNKRNFQKQSQNKSQGSSSRPSLQSKPSQTQKQNKFSLLETPPAEIPQSEASHSGRKRSLLNEKAKEKEDLGEENSKFFKQIQQKKSSSQPTGTSVPKEISIMENIQVGELAKKLNLKPNDVIAKLMKMGMMVTINNVIDSDTAAILADEYGCKVKIVSLYEETVIQEEPDNPEDYVTRPPVVT